MKKGTKVLLFLLSTLAICPTTEAKRKDKKNKNAIAALVKDTVNADYKKVSKNATIQKGLFTTLYNAKEGNEISDIALIVLVDGKTASAAEVLAAALQEQGRAKVVGSKSFGKGSIQELKLLPNNSEIALTTAYFYTPSGRKLHQEGIMPDICTAFAKTEQEAISAKNYSCEKEGRENKQLDIDIAKRLIAEKSHKPVLLR